MHEFFKGWRRKAGCGFLVVAMAIAILWARSVDTMDTLTRSNSQSRDMVISLDGTISFSRLRSSSYFDPEFSVMFSLFGDDYTWYSEPSDNGFGFDEQGARIPSELFTGCSDVQRWDLVGITIGSGIINGGPMNEPVIEIQHYVFPYWSMVLPLTFLSAYLILWKPRKAK